VQPVDEHAGDEVLRGPGGHVAVEGQREHVVDAALLEQLGAHLDGGQRRRRVLGTQHRHRVRVEGHRDHREPALVRDLPRAGEHVAVTEVDAVEVADDDDRAAQVGRHVVEGTPHLHVLNPTVGPRYTKTALALAIPSRGS
jgi:hypothetical protein